MKPIILITINDPQLTETSSSGSKKGYNGLGISKKTADPVMKLFDDAEPMLSNHLDANGKTITNASGYQFNGNGTAKNVIQTIGDHVVLGIAEIATVYNSFNFFKNYMELVRSTIGEIDSQADDSKIAVTKEWVLSKKQVLTQVFTVTKLSGDTTSTGLQLPNFLNAKNLIPNAIIDVDVFIEITSQARNASEEFKIEFATDGQASQIYKLILEAYSNISGKHHQRLTFMVNSDATKVNVASGVSLTMNGYTGTETRFGGYQFTKDQCLTKSEFNLFQTNTSGGITVQYIAKSRL
jgi:hypothetical protein